MYQLRMHSCGNGLLYLPVVIGERQNERHLVKVWRVLGTIGEGNGSELKLWERKEERDDLFEASANANR